MHTLTEGLVAWMACFAATVMLFGGASVFVAGLPLVGISLDPAAARRLGVILFQLGGMFVVAGVASLYLSRAFGPNYERLVTVKNKYDAPTSSV